VLVVVALLIGDVLDGAFHLDALDSDLFSLSSLAAFVGAFGFGGALGLAVIDHVAFAVVVGLVVGALAAWLAIKLTRVLKADDSAVSFRSDSMIGHAGRVITAIPADGYGEITLSVAGHVRKFSAKSALPVEAGTEVWVSGILSPTAVEVTQTSGPQELTR
jgi:membrane protein implicated in regulation of membrane protease activity